MKKIISASILMILVLALSGCSTTNTTYEERTRIIDSKNLSSVH